MSVKHYRYLFLATNRLDFTVSTCIILIGYLQLLSGFEYTHHLLSLNLSLCVWWCWWSLTISGISSHTVDSQDSILEFSRLYFSSPNIKFDFRKKKIIEIPSFYLLISVTPEFRFIWREIRNFNANTNWNVN